MSRFTIRRIKLRAAGICIYCGSERADDGKTLCGSCCAVKAAKRARDCDSANETRKQRLREKRGVLWNALQALDREIQQMGGVPA